MPKQAAPMALSMALKPIPIAEAILATLAVSAIPAKKAVIATAANVKTASVHRAHAAMAANPPVRQTSTVAVIAQGVPAASAV